MNDNDGLTCLRLGADFAEAELLAITYFTVIFLNYFPFSGSPNFLKYGKSWNKNLVIEFV